MPKRKVNLKKFTISQSKLRDYYKIPSPLRSGGSGKYNEAMCGIAWWYKYIEGKRTPPSLVMKKGLYFEHHLIGAARGGQEPPRLTTSEPKQTSKGWKIGRDASYPTLEELWANYVSPIEVELDEFLVEARKLFSALKIRKIDVQPEWIDHKPLNMESHVDLVGKFNGEECIIDIKYTETRYDDRWNGGWGAPEYLPWDTLVQPIHYTLHDWIRSGTPEDEKGNAIYKPFYYLVFGHTGTKGNKELWSRMIEVEVTEEAVGKHIDDIQRMYEELKTWIPKPINDFNVCKKCFYSDICSKKTKVPQIEKITV